ncbi:hypothetical protein SLS54_009786 [Diplodia seriata]
MDAASRIEFETTPPPSDRSSTNKQINAWLDYCRETHEACVSPMNPHYDDEEDIEPELPRRVLDVGEASTPSTVRLVEANGLHAHYVALSHCWGPPDKHPLRTTTATLAKHLKGIEFEQLPKTFQDAAIITRALGLKYLWIDSLCILQDNEDEWREEVGKMGSLYQLATLTVAASGAHDASEGCYMSKTGISHPSAYPTTTTRTTKRHRSTSTQNSTSEALPQKAPCTKGPGGSWNGTAPVARSTSPARG